MLFFDNSGLADVIRFDRPPSMQALALLAIIIVFTPASLQLIKGLLRIGVLVTVVMLPVYMTLPMVR